MKNKIKLGEESKCRRKKFKEGTTRLVVDWGKQIT